MVPLEFSRPKNICQVARLDRPSFCELVGTVEGALQCVVLADRAVGLDDGNSVLGIAETFFNGVDSDETSRNLPRTIGTSL